jgi:Tfp pilus assembly protein PilV
MRRPPSDPRPTRSGEAGFSLLETLIAAAVLLLILIGLLPLFERSRLNLMQGNDATRVSNATIENAERLLALPFNGFLTNLTPGGPDYLVSTDFWLLNGDTWAAAVPVGDTAQFTRRTVVQQFGVSEATDSDAALFVDPLDSDTPPGQVHYKRIVTEILNPRLEGTLWDPDVPSSGPGTGPGVFRIIAVQAY